jgi:hypothetical protein
VGVSGIDVFLNVAGFQMISGNLSLTLMFASTIEFSF